MMKYQTSNGLIFILSLLLGIFIFPALSKAQTYADCVANNTYVGGQVYLDYNSNKTWEASGNYSENGAPGVTVFAYLEDGSLVASTITDAAGGWAINVGNGVKVRVEFRLPDHFVPAPAGSASKSDVAFATAPACDLNFGVHDPKEYCETDPEIITVCNVKYWVDGEEDQIVTVDYSDGSNSETDINLYFEPHHPVRVNNGLTGNLWGLTYNKDNDMLYAATSYKKGANASADGLGSIYYIDNSVNDGTDSSVVQATLLHTLFGGPDPTNGNPGEADVSETYFTQAFDAAGKYGLGGIAMNGAGDSIWTVNLYTRKLEGFQLSADGKTKIGSKDEIDMPSPANCTGDEIRPWALKWYRGKFYVGMVCSGEITQDLDTLRAYVYTYTPGDVAMSANPVIEFPLNYPRLTSSYNVPAEWNPWKTVWDAANPMHPIHFNASYQGSYPSPILADIEFDKGDMIIGLADRFPDQFRSDLDPAGMINPGNPISIVPAGDILKAGLNADGATWTLEANGVVVSSSKGTYSSTGSEAGSGPGGAEFFNGERYSNHKETSLGGLANLNGRHQVVSAAFDPAVTHYEATGIPRWGSGGLVWHNNDNGDIEKAWEGYYSGTHVGNFGKGNGFGDIEAICRSRPMIQIGNLVWSDANNNGVQDAGEAGMNGVNIMLYSATGTVLATTTSDANGNYSFSDDSDPNQSWSTAVKSVEENTTYYVVYGDAQFASDKLVMPSDDYFMVNVNQTNGSMNQDKADSDALLGDVSDPAFVQDMPFVMVTTSASGENIHNTDIGFVASAALPVQLMNITATQKECLVSLEWKVAYSENFSHFEVELSADERNFQKIATVEYDQNISNYALHNLNARVGTNYFRLKMFDQDGNFKFSEIVNVKGTCNEALGLKLYPNPVQANQNISLEISSNDREIGLLVLDPLGRKAMQIQQTIDSDKSTFDLSTTNMTPGTYVIILTNGTGHQLTRRVVVY